MDREPRDGGDESFAADELQCDESERASVGVDADNLALKNRTQAHVARRFFGESDIGGLDFDPEGPPALRDLRDDDDFAGGMCEKRYTVLIVIGVELRR